MPVIPEKLTSRQEVRNAISAQFWEQFVQSSRSIDGLARNLPGEPTPLSQTGYSGLSRTQQLIIYQALGIPVFPSYNEEEGGIVVDRVLAKVGNRLWWSVLSGRLRAQRLWEQRQSHMPLKDAFKDLHNYGLCLRSRWTASKDTVFNSTVEIPNVGHLREHVSDVASSKLPLRQSLVDASQCVSCRGSVKKEVAGHDVFSSVSWHSEYLDSFGGSCMVPVTACFDVASKERSDGLQYRAGLHKVSAPNTEVATESTIRSTSLRSSLHFQGAVAVEGEAIVWRPNQRAHPASADDDKYGGGGGGVSDEGAHDPSFNDLVHARHAPVTWNDAQSTQHWQVANSSITGQREAVPTLLPTIHSPAPSSRSAPLANSAVHAVHLQPPQSRWNNVIVQAVHTPDQEADFEADQQASPSPSEHWQLAAVDRTAGTTRRAPEGMKPMRSGLEWEDNGKLLHQGVSVIDVSGPSLADLESSLAGMMHTLQKVNPEAIQSGIQGAIESIQNLRDAAQKLSHSVQEANRKGDWPLGDGVASGRAPRRPYSTFVAEPYVKLNAAMGCLARIPLAYHGFVKSAEDSSSSSSTAQHSSRLSAMQRIMDTWAPYLKDTALRVFASASISAQLGNFCRPLLDYSAAALRVDLGMTSWEPRDESATTSSGRGLGGAPQHRAFALEGVGTYHALTLSLAQQLIGPIRGRADIRWALDATDRKALSEGVTWQGVVNTISSIRPSLMGGVVGVDVVVPGTEGAARFALWCDPIRKEAMAEMRLF